MHRHIWGHMGFRGRKSSRKENTSDNVYGELHFFYEWMSSFAFPLYAFTYQLSMQIACHI